MLPVNVKETEKELVELPLPALEKLQIPLKREP
jgi:hypothetical protein